MAIFFGSADALRSTEISRAVKAGKMRKLAAKIYTDDLKSPPEEIIRRHRLEIVAHFYPGAVISHRSAIEANVSPGGNLHITLPNAAAVRTLPGLEIRIWPGPTPQPDDIRIGFREDEQLFTASHPRALLENLQVSRARGDDEPKTLSSEELERWLDRQIRTFGSGWIDEIRGKCSELGARIGWTREAAESGALLGALKGMTTGYRLATDVARSRAQGQPFDPDRLLLFRNLHARLAAERFNELSRPPGAEFENRAFWEAYFSNFIEGTKFTVDEARAIVFDPAAAKKLEHKRPDDAHDVRETYRLIVDPNVSAALPKNPPQLMELIKRRHARMMASRIKVEPGVFKTLNNSFGSRSFVKPELVEETLARGWPASRDLPSATARALYVLFLISEVHPFNDGNGRISRLGMNAELEAAGQARFIIPTSFRIDYLTVLEALTTRGDAEPFVAFGHKLVEMNSRMLFDSFDHSHEYFRATGGLDEATSVFSLASLLQPTEVAAKDPAAAAARVSESLRGTDRPSQLALFKQHAAPLRGLIYRHSLTWKEKLDTFDLADPPPMIEKWSIPGSDDLDVNYAVRVQQKHHTAYVVIAYQTRATGGQCMVYRATFRGMPRTPALIDHTPWTAVLQFDGTRPNPDFSPLTKDFDSTLSDAIEVVGGLIARGEAD